MLIGNATAVAMFAIGLLMMVVILMRRFRALTRRSRRADPHRAVRDVRKHADGHLSNRDLRLSGAPADAGRWTAEMNDIARETRAELDSKIRVLQATMREADIQARRLASLVRQAEEFQLGSDQNVVDEIDRLTDSLERVGRLEDPVGSPSHSIGSVDTNYPEAVRDEVCELIRTGLSPHYVANQTGLEVGDVELIVSLETEN